MADTFTWNGGTGGYADPRQWTDQTTPANTGSAVPGASDTAEFDTAGAVSGSGSAATLEVGAALGWTATVAADVVTVAAAGTLTMTAGSLQGGGTQTVAIDGTADVSGGTLGGNYVDDEGTVAVSGTGTIADNFAAIGASGTGSATVAGTGASWTNATGELQVGGTGSGTLAVSAGAKVSSAFAGIADSAGGSGTVTLDGAGTTWTAGGSFAVGYGGAGTLDVTNGAVVNSDFGSIGYLASGDGTATVDGAGSQWNNTTAGLEVGAFGTGALTISNGGAVTAQFAGVGDQDGKGNGTVTVTDAGSTWTDAGNTEIGTVGTGTFTVENGGSFSSTYVDIGTGAGGTGSATVDNATWTQSSNLNVGGNGGSGTFDVLDGAGVTVGGGIYIAASASTSATGTGVVSIASGSTVTVNGLYGVRVAQAPGDVGTLMVDGLGTLLTMAGPSGGTELGIGVGTAGDGTFVISNQAVADADYLTIGGSVVAYPSGTTATGTIESGATVSTAHGAVGEFGSNASLTIDGATWTATGQVDIGEEGAATGSVLVDNAGVLSDGTGDVGTFGPDSSGHHPTGSVMLDGGTWDNAGALVIGDAATGSLTVVGSSSVSSGGDLTIGSNGSGTGSVTVDNTSTLSVGGRLFVGDYGYGLFDTETDVTTGGDIVLGGADGGSGQATVEAGATLATPTALFVGDAGDAMLRVTGKAQAGGDVVVGGAATGTGRLQVNAGGSLSAGGNLFAGDQGQGAVTVSGAATVTGDVLLGAAAKAQGTLTVNGGSLAAAGLYVGGGTGGAGGTGSVEIGAGGTVTVAQATVYATGAVVLNGGSLLTDPLDLVGGLGLSGFGSVTGSIADGGSLLATGGLLDIAGGVSGAGSAAVGVAATLEFGAAVSVAGGVAFQGGNATMVLDAPGLFSAPIANFATTDLITLGKIANLGTAFTGSTLDVFSGANLVATLGFVGAYDATNVHVSKDTNGVVDVTTDAPCFAAGTRIRTPSGEVPVEALRVGDLVMTNDGEALPVRWIGRRTLRPDAHPRPAFVRPVRILRDAVAPGVPHADLVVSPDHALLIDGALVQARRLLNGATVRQEAWLGVTYLHVELERHAILLAECMEAESYLDGGNRAMFANAGGVASLHHDGVAEGGRTRACAPAMRDAEPAWRTIAARARALGHDVALPGDAPRAAPWLVAGDRRVDALFGSGGEFTFALPPDVRRVRLCAVARVPAEAAPWSDDRRRLGVPVAALAIDGAPRAIDDPALASGWWPAERADGALVRWTDGDAAIPVPEGACLLAVRLAGASMRPSMRRGAPAAMAA